jgi:myo-inositol 2-dehydrogenase/D-chiro-inositol 1-dehydrogenase
MRVAVIGAGSMGGRHAQLLGGLRGVDEVLVVDALPDRATAVAGDIGGRAVTYDEALDVAGAIVVATPAELHAATVTAAIERRIPVLCEKPLTEDLATSRALVELVEATDAHVEVGFQRRHDPGYLVGRRQVADGSAGRIHLLRLTAFDPLVTPRAATEWTPNEAAPLFLHSSTHDFDFVRWMSGQEVIEVSVEGSRRDEARPDDPRGVETAVVTMRLSEGTLAVLTATWLHPAGYDNRAELIADHIHLTMGLSPRTPAVHADWDGASGEPWPGYLARFEAAYRAELVAFLAAARGEQPPASRARDGLEALRIAVATTIAYRERRPVRLTEI